MVGEISIWRWALEDHLEACFAEWIGASDVRFAALAEEAAGPQEQLSVEAFYAQAEAKVRAMNLPAAELATTLAGLQSMRAEALEAEEDESDPQERPCVALASSHLFTEAPYADLEIAEIEAQAGAALSRFAEAISAVVGHGGQSLLGFLGLAEDRPLEDEVIDLIVAAGLAQVVWLWVQGDRVVYLAQWQEDRDLPIDLEFSRAPLAVFEALRADLEEDTKSKP